MDIQKWLRKAQEASLLHIGKQGMLRAGQRVFPRDKSSDWLPNTNGQL